MTPLSPSLWYCGASLSCYKFSPFVQFMPFHFAIFYTTHFCIFLGYKCLYFLVPHFYQLFIFIILTSSPNQFFSSLLVTLPKTKAFIFSSISMSGIKSTMFHIQLVRKLVFFIILGDVSQPKALIFSSISMSSIKSTMCNIQLSRTPFFLHPSHSDFNVILSFTKFMCLYVCLTFYVLLYYLQNPSN